MKTLRFLVLAAVLFAGKSLFAQVPYNYWFRSVDSGGGVANHWFGDSSLTAPHLFLHDASGPVQVPLGVGIIYSSGQIKLDLAVISTVGLSGSYNDLTNKPSITTIQRVRAQTDASGNYTWTYPSAYGSGVVPIISVVAEGGSTVPLNVQIVGVPSNTSVTFKVLSLPSTSILGIVVLGAPAGAQAYLHVTAVAP